MRPGAPFAAVLAVVFIAQLAGGCSTRDMEKSLYVGAKVAYDSLRASNQPSRQ